VDFQNFGGDSEFKRLRNLFLAVMACASPKKPLTPLFSPLSSSPARPYSSMKSAATTTIITILTLHPPASPIVEGRVQVQSAKRYEIVSRGGANNNLDTVIDDDELDHLVDELISGRDDSDADDLDIAESDEYEIEAGGGRVVGSSEPSENVKSDEAESDDDEDKLVQLSIGDEILRLANENPTIEQNRVTQQQEYGVKESTIHSRSAEIDSSNTRFSTLSSRISTPTNAYYRFVVRRGPAGHLLASFTLVAVQFIYTYIPFLYQTVASLLLRLHIYDPRVLYEKDRQRQMRTMHGRQTKQQGGGGLASKLFGTSSRPLKKHRATIQKHADQVAATTLKQLYRTMKIENGLGMLSEVKYRYLSLAFQRKYSLGKEYRIEKPRTFMGEVVDGNNVACDFALEEKGIEGLVTSDFEFDEEEIITSTTRRDQSSRRRGRKSKRSPSNVNDWVLQAFTSHRSLNTSSNHTRTCIGDSSNVLEVSSLWKSVNRDAIIDAAKESFAADQSFTMQKDTSHGDGINDMGSGDINGGGYSASKVLHSVMTRVGGSSGRIFGAYPNDTPPIENCSHKRGVLSLARRYGYGNWIVQHRANPYSSRSGQQNFDESIQEDDDDDIEDNNDDSWGGGNLI